MAQLPFKPVLLTLHCPKCGTPLFPIDEKVIEDYVSLKQTSCSCSHPLDLWEILKACLASDNELNKFALIGGTYFTFPLKGPIGQAWQVPWKVKALHPEGKLIEDKVSVIEGDIRVVKYEAENDQTSLGFLASTATVRSGTAKIEAVFVPYKPNFSQERVIDSIKAFNNERYEEMVISSNVAVEVQLYQVLAKIYDPVIGTKRRETFFKDGLTYGHMLSTALPLACRLAIHPMLPEDVLTALGQLKKARNDVAHTGQTPKQFKRQDFANMVIGAAIACRFLVQLSLKLDAWTVANEEINKSEQEQRRLYRTWKAQK